MGTGRTQTEERLCAVAGGDLRPLELRAEMDGDTHRLVQIAALVALDGPLISWVAQLDAAGIQRGAQLVDIGADRDEAAPGEFVDNVVHA